MPNLMPADIAEDVRAVLARAAKGKGDGPVFLTAYQVLDRLPADVRDRLVDERGLGGRGSGVSYSAVGVVSDAVTGLGGDVVVDWLDTRGLRPEVAGNLVTPGYEICAVYKIRS